MTKRIIIEGARGVGKSTVVRKLRDAMTNTIAINFTGNNANTEEAKFQTMNHYTNWLTFFSHEQHDKSPISYIFDRFFFSEMVYSSLYKDYDFTENYNVLLARLNRLSNPNDEVIVIHLLTGADDLKRNLQRDGKAHLFDSEKFADDAYKSVEQMIAYGKVFEEAKTIAPNISFKEVDCTNMTLDEVVMCVQHLIK